ncbi:MAG: hypothetical protein NWQ23_02640, partial [Yoonia sp.]|uniref:hypothetical protein n=1 Tax=Yoonia sp. TaxID=2212373 RepID=UPI00273D7106
KKAQSDAQKGENDIDDVHMRSFDLRPSFAADRVRMTGLIAQPKRDGGGRVSMTYANFSKGLEYLYLS